MLWFVLRNTPVSWVLLRFWPPRAYVKIVHEDRILLVQNWLGSGKWSFPGGGLHRREDSKVGACREVFEETGLVLKPENIKFLVKGFSKYRFGGKKFVIYETTLQQQPKIVHDSELISYGWVKFSEIRNYDLTNAVKVALTKNS